ncbi:carbohydrate binding domain-containing protein [Exiguobacterium aurantiacum]|uniref:carbohydrate binding domain-containing protein n=1 Tax=Exiguobacterium aurantiacum TaxID=33987 RepID=UPI00384C8106
MPIITSAMTTLTDLNDAIVSTTAPSNPTTGTLWLDQSNATYPVFKRWSGTAWVVIMEGAKELSDKFDAYDLTLNNLLDDGKIDFKERQDIKNMVTDVIGYVIGDTATLPTSATLETGKKGVYYTTRQNARNVGIAIDDPVFVATETRYGELKTYMDSLSPKAWDTSSTNKNAVITVTKATFRDRWLQYSLAIQALQTLTSETMKKYVQSRTENLITNGSGLMGNNLNFNSFIFDKTSVYSGGGSFRTNTQNGTLFNDELVPVDPQQNYRFSLMAKSLTGLGHNYFGVVCHDIDGQVIGYNHVHPSIASVPVTTLARELKAGDTEIHLTSSTGFIDNAFAEAGGHKHSILFWGYTNKQGYTYPEKTYSRLVFRVGWNNGAINRTTHVITLNKPFSCTDAFGNQVTFPVGHKVSPTMDGSGYNYMTGSNVKVSKDEWQKFSGNIKGIGISENIFRPGTSFIKLLFLVNRNSSGGTAGDNLWLSNLEFMNTTLEDNAKAYTTSEITTVNATITNLNGALALRATKEEVKAIRIGTRNLIPNSSAEKLDANNVPIGWMTINGGSALTTGSGRLSGNSAKINIAGGGSGLYTPFTEFGAITPGKSYTISFWVKASQAIGFTHLMKFKNDVGVESNPLTSPTVTLVANTWTRYTETFTAPAGAVQMSTTPRTTAVALAGATLEIDEVKLEEGDYATEWSAAPEDLSGDIHALETRVQQAQEDIKPENILSTVIDAQAFKDVLSGKADAGALEGYVSDAEIEDIKKELKDYADGKVKDIDLGVFVQTTAFDQTKKDFDFAITSGGGVNLLRNSVGWVGADFWTVTGTGGYQILNGDTELEAVGSGSAWKLNAQGIAQDVNVQNNSTYTFSCMVWKSANQEGAYLEYDDGNGTYKNGATILKAEGYNWTLFQYTFKSVASVVKIRLRGIAASDLKIANVMLNTGPVAFQWQHARNEIYNTNVQFNRNGIIVKNNTTNGETRITPTEFAGYNKNAAGTLEKIFTLNGDTTEVKKLKATEQFSMGTARILQITSTNSTGWAFLPNK